MKCVWDNFIPQIIFLMIKIDNFVADLTNVLAKTKTLVESTWLAPGILMKKHRPVLNFRAKNQMDLKPVHKMVIAMGTLPNNASSEA